MAAIASASGTIQSLPMWPEEIGEPSDLASALRNHPDKEIHQLYAKSKKVFDEIASRDLDRWVVTFSGGKDSTLTALLAAEYLAQTVRSPHVDVVYSDTLLEIPAMRTAAGRMLEYLPKFAEAHDVDLQVHIVRPKVEQRFWVRMIGRGYPPPKPKFRWCTRRIKIEPAAKYVNTGKPTAVLTGVRYGESASRTSRLVASCTNGGECGQDYWADKGPKGSNITYFAPIIDWRTCKVWDFLHFVAPRAGWPTQEVFALYGDTSLRFGCWTCTLVRRDKTVETLMTRSPGSTLDKLHEFREAMYKESFDPANRNRKNGHLASLTLEFRSELLSRLLELQRETGLRLITAAEVAAIHTEWSALARK